MCTVKGSDVRPGVPLASLGLRLFCVAGVGQCALPSTPWRPSGVPGSLWQAWDNVHCQGVGCTPWGSFGVPGSPPLLRGRRGTLCSHSFTLTHSLARSLAHSLTHLILHCWGTHTHIFILRVCSCILTAALFISWSIPSVGQRHGDCCTTLAFCLGCVAWCNMHVTLLRVRVFLLETLVHVCWGYDLCCAWQDEALAVSVEALRERCRNLATTNLPEKMHTVERRSTGWRLFVLGQKAIGLWSHEKG